ncbi:MAG TPA: hypothetical protein PK020_21125 [Ilumatobacteraceae bacterium]|nr:hypothetical protein [Ilumatobacteraceae bacterium]
MEPVAISGLLLRRAVLGILSGVTTNPLLLKGPSRVIADLLAYQARVGKVRKVGPATFIVISGSISRSTRWRCLHWRDDLERLRARVADSRALSLDEPQAGGSA